ncbi:MAG: oligosaccharide flippase family protein [Rhodospirillaceae bacterium]
MRALIWGVLEQGVAAANPFVVALVAVWLLPVDEHGRLALMAAGLAAGMAFHTALVLDPLTARGRARPATVGVAVALWALLAVVAGGIAVGVDAWAPGSLAAAAALGFAAAAGPALAALARRSAHLRRCAGEAAVTALLSVPPTAATAAAASSADGFLTALAGGALLSGALMVGRVVRIPTRAVARAALAHHRRLGGWLLVSAMPWVVATQAPVLILATAQGEAAAGALRALLLLALPVAHVSAAIGTVVQPRLAAAARRRDVRRSALNWGAVIGGLALPWLMVLGAAPEAVTRTLLGGLYHHAAGALPVVAVSALIGAVGAGPALALRAARRGRPIAMGAIAGAGAALLSALVLIPKFGIGGAAAALLAGRASDIAVQMAALQGRTRRRTEALAC